MNSPIAIEPLSLEDLDSVLEIERTSFPDPFSRSLFESELHQKAATLLVARCSNPRFIIGYIDYWIVLDEIHLINLAVHPDWRRQRIGRRLFQAMLDRAREARHVYLEVSASNEAAKKFYERLGFSVYGIRKEYYKDKEDALVMVMKCIPS